MTKVSAQPAMLRTRMAMLAMVGVLVGPPAARASFVTFESGQVRPLALSPDGTRLFAVNTPDDRLEIFDVGPAGVVHRESVPVGLEPVAVAARSNAREVWVVNHLSDSVSIVDVGAAPAARGPHAARRRRAARHRLRRPGRARRAFITTAHRGQNRPGDPQLTTPGVGRADVWVFDADEPRQHARRHAPHHRHALRRHAARPRRQPRRRHGLRRRLSLRATRPPRSPRARSAMAASGAAPASSAEPPIPAGCPRPTSTSRAAPQPEVGLIVRFNNVTNGHWEDELGRDWDAGVRFSLPDLDVFAIDANAATPARPPASPTSAPCCSTW